MSTDCNLTHHRQYRPRKTTGKWRDPRPLHFERLCTFFTVSMGSSVRLFDAYKVPPSKFVRVCFRSAHYSGTDPARRGDINLRRLLYVHNIVTIIRPPRRFFGHFFQHLKFPVFFRFITKISELQFSSYGEPLGNGRMRIFKTLILNSQSYTISVGPLSAIGQCSNKRVSFHQQCSNLDAVPNTMMTRDPLGHCRRSKCRTSLQRP